MMGAAACPALSDLSEVTMSAPAVSSAILSTKSRRSAREATRSGAPSMGREADLTDCITRHADARGERESEVGQWIETKVHSCNTG